MPKVYPAIAIVLQMIEPLDLQMIHKGRMCVKIDSYVSMYSLFNKKDYFVGTKYNQ